MEGSEKVLDTREWPEDGEYGDIIKLLHRIGDIVCTASEVTNEDAKKTLFTSAKILLDDCGKAIDERVAIEPVLDEEDD
jgi:hypothetical protein